MSVNSVVLSGRLTRDPELKTFGEDKVACKFSIAVDEFSKGEKRANFFDVIVWGKTAESCAQFLSKGRECAVSGKLRWRQWETPEGQKRSAVEVVGNHVQFFGGADGAEQKPKASAAEEEIPF
jgi:single-strand DNA-binding protein